MGCFWPELVQFVHGVAAGLADKPLPAKMLILFFADKTKGVPDVLLIVYVNVAVGERGVNVTLGAVDPNDHVACGIVGFTTVIVDDGKLFRCRGMPAAATLMVASATPGPAPYNVTA